MTTMFAIEEVSRYKGLLPVRLILRCRFEQDQMVNTQMFKTFPMKPNIHMMIHSDIS